MPDQYGNPTEAEMRGQAPANPFATYTQTPEIQAAIAARNSSGISTQDIYSADPAAQGALLSHEERATPIRDTSANAQAFQSAFMDDPYLQRSDVAPMIQATNKDVMGKGRFGMRGWLRDHPVGTIAAFIAAAAGGAAAMGGVGGAGGGTGGGLGIFSNGGEAGLTGVGGGNAGALAASGGITGGAGTGIAGSLGGAGLLSAQSIANAARVSSLVSNVQSALGAVKGAPSAPSQGGVAAAPSNPFGALIPSGDPGTYNDSNGNPLTAGSFNQNGFRDQNAFQYLMQTLGLPSPQGQAAAAPGAYAPPPGLEQFSGMDFGSMFGNLMGGGKFGLSTGMSSSPKTSPFEGYAAVNDGTRGPDVDPTSIQQALAGPLGNGGAAFGTAFSSRLGGKLSTRKKPRMIK